MQTVTKPNSDIKETEARAVLCDIKKVLLSKGIWCTVSETYDKEGLKFLKIEASAKVKQ